LNRSFFRKVTISFVAIAIFIFAIAEIMFVLYNHPYSLTNILGHLFRILAMFFLYWAIIDIGLSKPYEYLYKRLIKNRKLLGKKAKQLKSSNKDLESFTYSLSHDLRKELRIIDGHSAIMKSKLGKDPEPFAEHIDKIRTSVLNISEIIDSFIHIYNITQSNLMFQEINITDLASEIIENKKELYKDVVADYKVEENISIYSDIGLVKILFENLIDNAFKFSKKDQGNKIEVGSIIDRESKIIFVKDTGLGIDLKYHKKVFMPFEVFTDNTPNSTGIGLHIVKKVVDYLQGKIWFESVKDKGTIFYINIDRSSDEKKNNFAY
jgi:light-regulated signal transduction histidine kinase (bacteriophytochrome)